MTNVPIRDALAELVRLEEQDSSQPDSILWGTRWEKAWEAARNALAQRADEPVAHISLRDDIDYATNHPQPVAFAQRADEPVALTDPLHDDAYVRAIALGFPSGDARRWTLCRIADRIEAAAPAAPAYVPWLRGERK